jgi:DNA-binding XRE family transcriptional regulator
MPVLRGHSATAVVPGTLTGDTVPPRRTLVALPGVRPLRIRRALLQRQLAEAAGVSLITVQRIEAGGQAGLETAAKLATVLGVEPAELMRQQPET